MAVPTEIFQDLAQETDSRIVLIICDGLGGLPHPETGKTELETARTALQHTQQELASMWRVMSARRQRSAPSLTGMTNGDEAFDLPPQRDRLERERSRIQDQIARVRDLSKRRRWPWPQAS